MGVAHAGWEVQWIDTFDGNSVNWDNWTAQIQANYNNELQCYTDDETSADKNLEVSNGTLKIHARRQAIECPGLGGQQRQWTSGRLNSKDKQEFLYGRIEARIRMLDLDGGTWPAFWMLENRIAENPLKGDNDTVHWPNPGAGEIDVWEWFSNNGNSYITNFFNVSGCGTEFRPTYPGGAADVQAFHTYAIEWSADDIHFLMDDVVVASYNVSTCAQYKEPMFVLLNLAVGGNLGGAVDPSLMHATLEIDYVAHCTAANNSQTSCNETTPMVVDDDGDGVGNSLDQCPATPAGTPVGTDGCELPVIADAPTESAPVPSELARDVISLFSDQYNNIAGINYDPDWGQSTDVSQVTISDDAILKYSGLNYQGTDYDSNHQDVSDMDFLHVDYWTPSATELSIYLISPGPKETPYSFPVEAGKWVSTDIPLSHFAGVDLTDTFQLKVVGNGTVFLDNLYFGRTSSSAEADADMDGVADDQDQCPGSPAGSVVDAQGCENFAPQVTLVAMQGGEIITEVAPNGGTVTITAAVEDRNSDDSHGFSWSLNQQNSAGQQTMSFEPNTDDNRYLVDLTVTDSGQPPLTANASMTLEQAAAAPGDDDSGGNTGVGNGDGGNPPTNDASGSGGSGGGSVGWVMLALLLAYRARLRGQ
ncbi:hypothetical protein GCM10011369_25760 [Neiella marina]|uniref:GH16 domain-containing protein n=2 Tax=Neiella marina TaxID=508461 RepID=A0A8J2U702_9GAMM|nr:hypothetical protein GCM10011369_25760 [Neiella marina]